MRKTGQMRSSEAGKSDGLCPGSAKDEIGRPERNIAPLYGEKLWNVEDCRAVLRVSVNTLRGLVEERRIPHVWLNDGTGNGGERRGLRFVPALIRQWLIDKSRENYSPE